MKNLALFFTLFSLFSSCNPTPKTETTTVIDTTFNLDSQRTAPKITARKPAGYQGAYKGTLPCADCAGIKLEIDLKKDSTYVLETVYLGKGDEKPVVQKGTYTWSKTDSLIILNGIADQPNKYRVSHQTLSQLDMDGTDVIGPTAKRYILRK